MIAQVLSILCLLLMGSCGQPSNLNNELVEAVRKLHINRVKMLLVKGANPNAISDHFVSALWTAASLDDDSLVTLLLAHGGDVHLLGVLPDPGQQPLPEVVVSSDAYWVLPQLYTHGMPIDSTYEHGESLLHIAARSGSLKCAEFLVQHGLSVNALDSDDETPMNSAIEKGSPEMVAFLLSKGANPNATDYFHVSPLYYALIYYENDANPALQRPVDISQFGDSTGRTRHSIYSQIIALLLRDGAFPNIQNKNGETALKFAERLHDTSMIRFLKFR